MSVILGAARKSVVKPKAKPKKKKQHVQHAQHQQRRQGASSSSTPPVSGQRVKVWHWLLNDEATTVVYNRDENEVLCNNEQMVTKNQIHPDKDIEFFIITDTCDAHKARIQRTQTGDYREPVMFQLFVDEAPIMEHGRAPPIGTPPQPLPQASDPRAHAAPPLAAMPQGPTPAKSPFKSPGHFSPYEDLDKYASDPYEQPKRIGPYDLPPYDPNGKK